MTGLEYLGPALRRLREKRRMQQVDVVRRARELGHRLERSRISDWELGKKEPTLRSLFAYLQALDFRLRDLEQQIRALEFTEAPRAESPTLDPVAEELERAEKSLSSDSDLRDAVERLERLLASFRRDADAAAG